MKRLEAVPINRAVFLDRDGTVNREVNYLRQVEDLRLLPGVARGIRILKESGFLVVLVSNQSGIARGIFTEEDLFTLQNEINRRLKKQGASIDAFYYCPHHPNGSVNQYSIECSCRKPAPGLFLQASKDLDIDFSHSWAVGDRIRDLQAPSELGCRTVLVKTGYGKEELKDKKNWPVMPTATVQNLYQAAVYIGSCASLKGRSRFS